MKKRYRLKDKYFNILIISMCVICFIFLFNIVSSGKGVVGRINECLKTHDMNYCNNNVK